jgi:hypothetical protein
MSLASSTKRLKSPILAAELNHGLTSEKSHGRIVKNQVKEYCSCFFVSVCGDQGDQIGLFLICWAIVYFEHFLNYKCSPNLG